MFPNPFSTILIGGISGVDSVQLTPTFAPLNATVLNSFPPPLTEVPKHSNSQKRPTATLLQRARSFFNLNRLNRRKPYPKPPNPPSPELGSIIHHLPEGSDNCSSADPQTIIHIDIVELVENEVRVPPTPLKKVRPSLMRGSPFFRTFSFERRDEEEQGQGVRFVGGLGEAWRMDVGIDRLGSQHAETVDVGQEIKARDLPLEGHGTEPAKSAGPVSSTFSYHYYTLFEF
ncbi:hypothetical protein BGZ60DRAFT_261150 [Tricladium varicosporioides]|nr:hypothetical protein BGZ60DRAFT_261150 [Hymenoscyphus varicosporioides]